MDPVDFCDRLRKERPLCQAVLESIGGLGDEIYMDGWVHHANLERKGRNERT